ncbi:AraC family transcriptional regulator [Paenibacillus chungangensis]|uniref:AraC family transcriptional regulator n=1 Tax=Paenibacillus chungangensis TaxID=696535 RepID=A0ABW3HJZ0_9BACL
MRKKHFFIKLLVAYLVIIVLYTLIAAGVFLYKNTEIVGLELKTKQESFLLGMAELLDNRFKIAQSLIHQLQVSQAVKSYVQNDRHNYYNITTVYKELEKLNSTFYDLGIRIDLTRAGDSLVIKPENTISRYYYDQEMAFQNAREIAIPYKNRYSGLNQDITAYIKESGDENGFLMTFVTRTPQYTGPDLIFFTSFYGSFIMPGLTKESQEAFYIVNPEGAVLSASTLQEEYPSLGETIAHYDLPIAESFMTAEHDGLQLHIANSAILPGWKYGYAVPKRSFFADLQPQLIGIGAATFICMLLGMLAAYMLSRTMYRPIGRVVAMFNGFDNNEGLDEMAFISRTAVKIRRANEQLKSMMLKERAPLKDMFLRDMLHGLLTGEQIEARMNKLQMQLSGGPWTVVVLEMSNYAELNAIYSRSSLLDKKSQLIHIMDEQLGRSRICQLVALDFKRFAVLLHESCTDTVKKEVQHALIHMEAKVESPYTIGITAGVGAPAQALEETGQSYISAVRALEYRSFLDKRTVVAYSDVDTAPRGQYYYPLDIERDLISSVQQGKREEVAAILERLFDINFQQRVPQQQSLQRFSLAVHATIERILQLSNLQDMQWEDMELDKIHPESQQLWQQNIRNRFHRLLDEINREREGADSDLVERLLQYIHEHYHEDLSLTDLSSQHHFSPGYISTVFKQYTRQNFKDYLNQYRVRKAKEIMGSEQVKIADVALRVGCNNTNTFIRIFRKYVGQSPGQYAKQQN